MPSTNDNLRVLKFGVIYAFAFLFVMAAIVIIFLPNLQLSRLAVIGLFCLSIGLGAVFGMRAGCKS